MTNRERKGHDLAPQPSDADSHDDAASPDTRQRDKPDPKSEEAFRVRTARIRSWTERLAKTVRLDERLTLLVEFGLTDRDIAKAVPRAKPRSVRRWRTEGPPTTRLDERWEPIDDLCTIVGIFVADASCDEEATVAWLRSRHRTLAGERPLERIAHGDFDAVRHAAERHVTLAGADQYDPPLRREHAGAGAAAERWT
jgi:hypothetical protein